jgi:murein DD-endopeptidase MepM/ murein hydrolase activator NlpD
MANQIAKSNKWKDLYRLVILREETLEEVSSFKLTLLNIYIAVSSVIVLVSLIVVLLIFFTPLKKLVPGYGDPSEDPAYMELYRKVQDMEKQLTAYQIYTSNFRKMIMGFDTSKFEDAPPAVPPHEYLRAEERFQEALSGDEAGLEQPGASARDLTDTAGRKVVFAQMANVNTLHNLYLIPPVTGSLSSTFNAEIGHFGVDILAPRDTPVKAILDGYVITSDWTLETGNTIGIQHKNDLVSFYKHNAVLLKKVGDYVPAGEAIALVGNTGKFSTGPHLHFELWQNGVPVDPSRYIKFE